MKKQVICDICTKLFDTTTNRKYCNEDCSREGRKRRQTEYMRKFRAAKAEEEINKIIIPEKFLKRNS